MSPPFILVHRIAVPAVFIALLACGEGGPTGPVIASLALASPAAQLIAGQSLLISAVARNGSGDIITTVSPLWSTSAPSIASVSQAGVVTGRAAGSVTIRATLGALRDSVELTVTDNSADVFTPGTIFSPQSVTILSGGIVRFHIFGEPHNVEFDPATPGAPANINVVVNQIVALTFGNRGTFRYDCTVHPGMHGEVVVD